MIRLTLLAAGLCLAAAATTTPPAAPAAPAVAAPAAPSPAAPASTGPALRVFDLTYTATIPAKPGGGPLKIWLPVPTTGWDQTVENVLVNSPVPARVTTETAYGNRMLFAEAPGTAPVTLGWTVRVTRREHKSGGSALTATEVQHLRRLLTDDTRAVVHHPDVKLALSKANTDKVVAEDKPRAIYDYVVGHMVYDKVAPGWGQGDTLRACAVGKGNCTDFHSLFISMSRAAEIPAKFGIGFSMPKPPGGEVPGYHCWAYYFSKRNGWVPVDASEAFKHPELKEYYFGGLTADRVELTQGRDLILEPRQQGQPLNFFLNPYAEQGGSPVEGTEKKVSFKEVSVTH